MPSPASIAAPSAILRSALHRLVASAALLPPRAMGAQARVSAACAAPRFSRESFCSLRSFATSASLSGSGSPSGGGTIADRKRFIAPFPPAASGAHPSSASKRRRGGPEGPSADSARDERSGGVTGRCIAYCSADSYDLDALQALLLQRHRVSKRYGHDVLHVEIPASVPSFEADAFVFRDGSVVFWNARDSDIAELRGDLKPLESNPPPVTEFEEMIFKLGPSARVKSGVLLLTADADPREIAREKMAFSYGLQRSVRLAVIEEAVDSAIGGMRDIPVALLTHGRLKMKKADVMRSLGKLLALRGTINMHTDLLETPDIYWEHPRLEELYHMVSREMDIVSRVACTNRKLDYGKELIETLRTDIAEKHSSNAEIAIIVLISVEVCFALLHLHSDYKQASKADAAAE